MPRPGGELDFADRRLSRWNLRCDFLKVVREEVPEVLITLFRDVLPHYRTAAALRRAAGLYPSWIEEYSRLSRAEVGRNARRWEERYAMFGPEPNTVRRLNAFRALLVLYAELVAWAERFDLTDREDKRNGWVLETALETLFRWHAQDGCIGPLRLLWAHRGGDGTNPLPDEERQFAALDLRPGARPTLEEALAVPEEERRRGVPELLQETRAQAEARLMALGIPRREVRAELRRLDALLTARGMVRTPMKRNTSGVDPALHLRWLALYVCRGMTQEEIGKEGYGHTQQAISRGILSTAELLDLELPPERTDLLLRFTRRRS
jgi:hypothetical protein